MEARLIRTLLALAALLFVAATHRTPNFVVEAPTSEVARQVGAYAEHYRRELARAWLGKQLPNWYRPCSLKVKVGNVGAGGSTTFSFDRGEVFGWRMVVQGPLDRILVSVLPHEVSHTIFACHFRRPLPRWADEGAATLAEDAQEQQRQTRILQQHMAEGRCYSLRKLFGMSEYPRDVLALYAQGFSVAKFLMQKKGEGTYLAYLGYALGSGWDKALSKFYAFRDVEDLEQHWVAWVNQGSPQLLPESPGSIPLDRLPLARRPKPNILFRGQAPDLADETMSGRRRQSLGKEPVALASVSREGWRPAGARLAYREVPPPRTPPLPEVKAKETAARPLAALLRNAGVPNRFKPILEQPSARDPQANGRSGTTKRQPLHQRIAMTESAIPVAKPVTRRQVSSVPARRRPARRRAIGPAYFAQPSSLAPT